MLPDTKTVLMLAPQSNDTSSTVFGDIDTLGFDYLTIDLAEGTASASASAVGDLGLCESDTNPTNFAGGDAITACVGGSAVDDTHGFVFPQQGSNKTNIYKFNLDLRGRKRYIGCKYTQGVDASIAMIGTLSRGESGPAQNSSAALTADGVRLVVNA
jgi:hypothetical protein